MAAPEALSDASPAVSGRMCGTAMSSLHCRASIDLLRGGRALSSPHFGPIHTRLLSKGGGTVSHLWDSLCGGPSRKKKSRSLVPLWWCAQRHRRAAFIFLLFNTQLLSPLVPHMHAPQKRLSRTQQNPPILSHRGA